MRKILFLIVVFSFLEPAVCSSIRINEIMYDPAGDDNNREFIEVYFEEEQNLSGWVIADSSSNDTLLVLKQSSTNKNYALIVEEGFNSSGIDATIYSAGASIGNNLGNSADSIYLYDNNGSLIDSALYDGFIANGNGKSMEYDDGEWHESCETGGSPGRENCVVDGNGNNGNNNGTNTTTPEESGECRAVIVAYTDKEIYNATDKINIYFALYNDTFPYTIEYWIEDSSGEIVKSRYNTTNTDKKTWTPELEEKDGVFYVKASLYLDCGNETKRAYSESMFVVIGSFAEKRTESSIIIKEIYTGTDEKIEFGQPLRINAEIYKGDETKSTVEFWVEDDDGEKVSQTTKALFYDKFTEYDITIPIQLKPNCDRSYGDGVYAVVAEGLDLSVKEDVTIGGITASLCPDDGGEESSSSAKYSSSSSAGSSAIGKENEPKISYQLLNFRNKLNAGEEISNELLIQNDDQSHSFDVWSYVYRGSRSYSGEREGNKQTIELSPMESAIVELKNVVDEAEPGEYKFKVKIKKDSQKTNHEITEDAEIVEGAEGEKDKISNTNEGINEGLKQLKDAKADNVAGSVVYEGSSTTSKRFGTVFLLVSLFLISLIGLRNWLDRRKNGLKKAKGREKI